MWMLRLLIFHVLSLSAHCARLFVPHPMATIDEEIKCHAIMDSSYNKYKGKTFDITADLQIDLCLPTYYGRMRGNGREDVCTLNCGKNYTGKWISVPGFIWSFTQCTENSQYWDVPRTEYYDKLKQGKYVTPLAKRFEDYARYAADNNAAGILLWTRVSTEPEAARYAAFHISNNMPDVDVPFYLCGVVASTRMLAAQDEAAFLNLTNAKVQLSSEDGNIYHDWYTSGWYTFLVVVQYATNLIFAFVVIFYLAKTCRNGNRRVTLGLTVNLLYWLVALLHGPLYAGETNNWRWQPSLIIQNWTQSIACLTGLSTAYTFLMVAKTTPLSKKVEVLFGCLFAAGGIALVAYGLFFAMEFYLYHTASDENVEDVWQPLTIAMSICAALYLLSAAFFIVRIVLVSKSNPSLISKVKPLLKYAVLAGAMRVLCAIVPPLTFEDQLIFDLNSERKRDATPFFLKNSLIYQYLPYQAAVAAEFGLLRLSAVQASSSSSSSSSLS